MTTTIVSRVIRAPREAIYEACVDPQKLVCWRRPDGMRARIDAIESGGGYRMTLSFDDPDSGPGGKTTHDSDSFTATFVERETNQCVVERIVFDSADPQFAGAMTVSTLLRDAPGGIEVTIRCENLPPGIRPSDNELGCAMSLRHLAELVE
ncbi:MAG: SRPBCC domain-containing protein [Rhizomicrobium sp.]